MAQNAGNTPKDAPDRSLRLLSAAEVGEIIQASPRTVQQWAQMGRLRSVKAGKLLRFRLADVLAFIESNAN